jgi:hypothetical protein
LYQLRRGIFEGLSIHYFNMILWVGRKVQSGFESSRGRKERLAGLRCVFEYTSSIINHQWHHGTPGGA